MININEVARLIAIEKDLGLGDMGGLIEAIDEYMCNNDASNMSNEELAKAIISDLVWE